MTFNRVRDRINIMEKSLPLRIALDATKLVALLLVMLLVVVVFKILMGKN